MMLQWIEYITNLKFVDFITKKSIKFSINHVTLEWIRLKHTICHDIIYKLILTLSPSPQ